MRSHEFRFLVGFSVDPMWFPTRTTPSGAVFRVLEPRDGDGSQEMAAYRALLRLFLFYAGAELITVEATETQSSGIGPYVTSSRA